MFPKEGKYPWNNDEVDHDHKDHSTRLTNLVALRLKQAEFVAHKLGQLMGFIGYPMIFHTDNRTEFTAKQTLQKLKDINPFIQTVRGHARTQ